MTKTDKAWLAGFIDGEGTFTIGVNYKYRGLPYYNKIFAVSNTNRKALVRIVGWFGGKVSPPRDNGPNRKPIYQLLYQATRCRQVIKATLPYLVLKREVAEAVLNFPLRTPISKGKAAGSSPDYKTMGLQKKALTRIRKLNKRGL